MSTVDTELNNSDSLPFSKKPQDAVLGYMLIDKNFFLFCKDKIKAKWFQSTLNGRIFDALCEFYNKFKEFPSIEQLIEWPSIATEEIAIKNKIELNIKVAIQSTADYAQAWIESRLQEWLQVHTFTESMERAAYLYNKSDFKGAFDTAREGIRKVDSIVLDPNKEFDPNNWINDFTESTAELEDALGFGVRVVDERLNPLAKGGALLKGDTTVVLAPVNIGKTTCLITTVCYNILREKDVLFLTHEGRMGDIRDKIYMNILNMDRASLYSYVAQAGSDPEVMATMASVADLIKKHLTWIPLTKAGLSIEEVDVVIRQKFDEKRHRDGKGYDMIADDYPAKLTTIRNSKGNLEKRHEDNIVYDHFVQLALEFKAHSLLAIQANREGSRVNRGQKGESRLLTPEDVSEAFGPIQTATNIITINRDPTAQAKKMLTYYICKSRSSEVGFAVVCKTDFAKGVSHSDNLGATWYRGTARLTDSERMDDILSQHDRQEVPLSAIIDAGVEDER